MRARVESAGAFPADGLLALGGNPSGRQFEPLDLVSGVGLRRRPGFSGRREVSAAAGERRLLPPPSPPPPTPTGSLPLAWPRRVEESGKAGDEPKRPELRVAG